MSHPTPESPDPSEQTANRTDTETTAETSAEREPTVVLVSRSRSLNLGGMVVLAIAVGAIAGVVWGVFEGVTDMGTIVLGALYGAMFIGGGLSLIIVLIDWMMERSRTKD